MAIAPLEEMDRTGCCGAGAPELPWPRPPLQVLAEPEPYLQPAWEGDPTGDGGDAVGYPDAGALGASDQGVSVDWWTTVPALRPAAVRPAALRPAALRPAALRPATDPFVASDPFGAVRQGLDVADRRRRRVRVRVRRRRLLTAAALGVLVIGLALPLQALGGRTASPAAVGQFASVYVVQPGDTVSSIAMRFAGGRRTRALASALVKEAGSDAVVPGEHLAVP